MLSIKQRKTSKNAPERYQDLSTEEKTKTWNMVINDVTNFLSIKKLIIKKKL